MSKIIDEMLNEDKTEWDMNKIILTFAKLEKRISELEKNYSYGGVYVDGSPEVVKKYYDKFEEKLKGDK